MDLKPSSEEFAHKVAVASRLRAEAAKMSVGHFLNQIVIPSSPSPMLFGKCADPWQRQLLAPKIAAFEFLAGRNPTYDGPRRFMSILARGHNKSSLEAWLVAALLMTSERQIHGYILAADRDQGRLILQALSDLLGLNPWLNEYLKITKDVIHGPGGDVEVLPADAGSNMGLRGNLYILDEFVHWKNQKVWTSIVSGFRKVNPTIVVALSNAGLIGSWQHESFLAAEASPEWMVFHREGTLASWLDQKGLDEDRVHLPPSEAERLYDNKWIDPATEHDYLRRTEVDACARLGEAMGLMIRVRKRFGTDNYVVGIDYGPKRDRTVMTVLHQQEDRVVVIDKLDVWQGCDEETGKVPITKLEAWIQDVRAKFAPVSWVIDPYQMEGTIQWMEREGLPVEAFQPRSGAGNYAMAQHLRSLVVEQRLVWYPGAGNLRVKDRRTGGTKVETLMDELVALRVKRTPDLRGYRFDHENQKHDDRAVSIGMAALKAAALAPVGLPGPPTPLAQAVRALPGEGSRT